MKRPGGERGELLRRVGREGAAAGGEGGAAAFIQEGLCASASGSPTLWDLCTSPCSSPPKGDLGKSEG